MTTIIATISGVIILAVITQTILDVKRMRDRAHLIKLKRLADAKHYKETTPNK